MDDVFWPQMTEGFKETIGFYTDVEQAQDGTELRVAARSHPITDFELTFDLMTQEKVNFARALMFKRFATTALVPMMHTAVKLDATAALGASALVFENEFCDVRNADQVLLFDRSTYEIVTCNVASATGCTLTTTLVSEWTEGAWVCPIRALIPRSTVTMSRMPVDGVGQMQFRATEQPVKDPFLSPYNARAFGTYNSLPLVDQRPQGTSFDDAMNAGLKITDFGNSLSVISDWLRPKLTFNFNWRVERTAADRGRWLTLFDGLKGSRGSFYMPSWREDILRTTTPAMGATSFVAADDLYSSVYSTIFPRIFIETDAGLHPCQVTSAVPTLGKDTITFTPALPTGTGWETVRKVGLLYLVRVDRDEFEFEHFDLETTLSLSLITVTA
jgi:hypothetical protein